MTTLRMKLAATGLLAVLAAWTLPVAAEARGMGREDLYSRGPNLIDTHVRYPGDTSYSFGNYRHRGPEQGPYVERCAWSLNTFFGGLPLGITQTCVRYTNENTN
jgi:hypothetical protein